MTERAWASLGETSSPATTPAAPRAACPTRARKPRRDSPTLVANFSAALLIFSNTIHLLTRNRTGRGHSRLGSFCLGRFTLGVAVVGAVAGAGQDVTDVL